MSTNFSCNQYENAFGSKVLGNWEKPHAYKGHPVTLSGHTKIVADDRGALLSTVKRSDKNPWGNFVGTWDLPVKIPGDRAIVPTGRTSYAKQKLVDDAKTAQKIITGKTKNDVRLGRNFSCLPPIESYAPVPNMSPTCDARMEEEAARLDDLDIKEPIDDRRSPSPMPSAMQYQYETNPSIVDMETKPLVNN